MTIGGIIEYIFVCLFVAGFIMGISAYATDAEWYGWVIGLLISAIVCAIIFGGFRWYYTKTESGARAIKTEQSNLNGGIRRSVKVYDATGNLIQEYEGTFDIEYDDDRILFDDENGLRHIIYYPTGTVIIDEIGE